MSINLKNPSRPVGAFIGAPRLPQVNLLPPEVRAARGLVRVKQWLGLLLVVVLLLLVAGLGAAFLARQSADSEIVDAQAEATLLRTEEAKYAEVPQVVNNLRRSEDARALGMATEVLWKGYLDAIAAVLPPNVSIETFTVTQETAAQVAASAPDALAAPGVGSISFTSTALTLPDSAAWLDALDSVPGFYAATSSTESLGTVGTIDAYSVTSTVLVDESAFAARFAATANDATAATEGN
jgi:Tfp pilus assembly protein PilN